MRVGSMNGIGERAVPQPLCDGLQLLLSAGTRARVRVPSHAQPSALDRSEFSRRVRLDERSPWRRVGLMNGIGVGAYSPNTAFWGF